MTSYFNGRVNKIKLNHNIAMVIDDLDTVHSWSNTIFIDSGTFGYAGNFDSDVAALYKSDLP